MQEPERSASARGVHTGTRAPVEAAHVGVVGWEAALCHAVHLVAYCQIRLQPLLKTPEILLTVGPATPTHNRQPSRVTSLVGYRHSIYWQRAAGPVSCSPGDQRRARPAARRRRRDVAVLLHITDTRCAL